MRQVSGDGCFFSSRRRHTRLQGDWSSDVCSSDLSLRPGVSPFLRQSRSSTVAVRCVLLDERQSLVAEQAEQEKRGGLCWRATHHIRCRQRIPRGSSRLLNQENLKINIS